MHLSNYKNVSADGVWIVATTVKPRRDSFFKSFAILYAEIESKPEVGSSSKTKLGLVTNSYPIETFLSSPFLISGPI